MPLDIVVLGLSITSSWGNGHATTYRSLLRALAERGHNVTFLERDVPWYAGNRDLPSPPYCSVHLYSSVGELEASFSELVARADLVIVGSFVPQGAVVGEWVLTTAGGLSAFYDIDTPVTLAKLARGGCDYLMPAQVARYGLYLSFTGGPTLGRIEQDYGSRCARALYCSVDADVYRPTPAPLRYDLGYLGTYSADRQPGLESLLLEPARLLPDERFAVAGPQYPETVAWPDNVERIEHLSPPRHPEFYASQRFTLNLTRADMVRAGYSPSVRLFEAAACGVPVMSDYWSGLDELFMPGREIVIVRDTDDVLETLRGCGERTRHDIAKAARRRVLAHHTSRHRARELEQYFTEAGSLRRARRAVAVRRAPASHRHPLQG